jgi:hypothetical protein
MSEKNGKPAVALVLGILIVATAATFAILLQRYAAEAWRLYALWGLAAVIAIWLCIEIRGVAYYRSALKAEGSYRPMQNVVSTLVLMNEESNGIQSWDLRDKTGLVIGRSDDDSDVDIDLSDTEYFSLISNQHAVLNYTDNGWVLTDAGSQNGTALLKKESKQKLLLAPGEPVPVRLGDTIFIAGETVIKVR